MLRQVGFASVLDATYFVAVCSDPSHDYLSGRGGSEVILCSPNAGHVIYGEAAAQMVAVPDVAWEVFQRYTLP